MLEIITFLYLAYSTTCVDHFCHSSDLHYTFHFSLKSLNIIIYVYDGSRTVD